MKSKKIISIIPDLKDGNGHMLCYHKALGEALQLLRIKHNVLYYSENLRVNIIGWNKCLKIGNLDQNIKIYYERLQLSKFVLDCYKFIKSIVPHIDKKEKNILFVERFNIPELLCLGIVAIISKTKIIILFRHDQNYLRGMALYKIILNFINFFNKSEVVLATDSMILTKNLAHYLNVDIQTLPIPLKIPKLNSIDTDELIKVWWPGAPRKDKGWSVVSKLLNEIKSSELSLKIYLSNELFDISNKNIIYIDKYLTDKDYFNYLNRSDIILLPYCKIKYSASTSNIFVEAIILKKKVLVTKGTWMESELKSFGLDCLAVDWDKSEIAPKIIEAYQNNSIMKKICIMSEFYSKFHSVEGYSVEIKKIINKINFNA